MYVVYSIYICSNTQYVVIICHHGFTFSVFFLMFIWVYVIILFSFCYVISYAKLKTSHNLIYRFFV